MSYQDITEDYQKLIKYGKYNELLESNINTVIQDLKNDCFLIEKVKSPGIWHKIFYKSFIGDIKLGALNEVWPIYQGTYLSPLIQLRIKDLPKIPPILSDIMS